MMKPFINRKVENNPFYMAPVEIIIPFHGEQARVTALMDSIFRTIHTNRYLITLVDDCSVNKEFVTSLNEAKLPGVRCLRQESHQGFGAAVNLALKNPWTDRIKWVAIVQSDVVAEDNHWLSSMGETLNKLKGDGVKMVGPMTNNPGVISEALTGRKGEQRADVILQDEFLPMYCCLAHRELFSRVGLFAECQYASIEAEEFASRMQSRGFKQAVSGSAWVNHEGGATLANFAQDKNAQRILRNIKEDFEEHMKTKG